MKRSCVFIATSALLAGVLSPSQAQFCWTPNPLPACRTFPITEIGFHYRISSSPTFRFTITDILIDSLIESSTYRQEQRFYVTSDLGFMRNLNRRYAMGASHFVGFDNNGEFRGGLKLRVRRWLTDKTAIDFCPGILLWDSNAQYQTPGFTGSVDLKLEEWFALSLVFDYRRYPRGENTFDQLRYVAESANDTGVYIGMKSGSYPGLIANSAGFILALIIGSLYYFGDYEWRWSRIAVIKFDEFFKICQRQPLPVFLLFKRHWRIILTNQTVAEGLTWSC